MCNKKSIYLNFFISKISIAALDHYTISERPDCLDAESDERTKKDAILDFLYFLEKHR